MKDSSCYLSDIVGENKLGYKMWAIPCCIMVIGEGKPPRRSVSFMIPPVHLGVDTCNKLVSILYQVLNIDSSHIVQIHIQQ